MAPMPAVFDFDRYAQLFTDLGAAAFPAELHGHLVGRLSAGARYDHGTWLNVAQELLDTRGTLSEAGKVQLILLHDASLAELTGTGFDITLLLPDDSATRRQANPGVGSVVRRLSGWFWIGRAQR